MIPRKRCAVLSVFDPQSLKYLAPILDAFENPLTWLQYNDLVEKHGS